MTLFQNSQRLMSAEGVSTTKSGNVVYRLRFEDGSVYLTEPDGQVGRAVTNYAGKTVAIRLRPNRGHHVTRTRWRLRTYVTSSRGRIREIGRHSCRTRVCSQRSSPVVARS